jgi:hypothetical protein
MLRISLRDGEFVVEEMLVQQYPRVLLVVSSQMVIS